MKCRKKSVTTSSMAAAALASLLMGSACVAPEMQQIDDEGATEEKGFMGVTNVQNTDHEEFAHFEDSLIPPQSQEETPDATQQEQTEGFTPRPQEEPAAATAPQPTQPSQPSQTHESSLPSSPQKVWIVDAASQNKTIHHEATGHMEGGGVYTVCTSCGAELSSNADIDRHGDTVHAGSTFGWTDKVRPGTWVEDSPAWDEAVAIPEQGHWEYR